MPSSCNRRKSRMSGFRLAWQGTANSWREGGGARLMVSLPLVGTATEKSKGLGGKGNNHTTAGFLKWL